MSELEKANEIGRNNFAAFEDEVAEGRNFEEAFDSYEQNTIDTANEEHVDWQSALSTFHELFADWKKSHPKKARRASRSYFRGQ